MNTLRINVMTIMFLCICSTAHADDTDWDNLKRVIRDPEVHTSVRSKAVRSACENVNTETAFEMIEFGRAWIGEIDRRVANGENILKDERLRIESGLLAHLVIKGIPQLEVVMADHRPLLSFLELVVTRPWINIQVKYRSYALIVGCNAPLDMRQATAIKIVCDTEMSRNSAVPDSLLRVFDPSLFPTLRRCVRSSTKPASFNFAAASILAYYGDMSILPDLEARRNALAGRHSNMEGNLIYYVWEINIQHPPSQLLEYISSTEMLIVGQRRKWTIRRAVELGLPKSKIRQAILTHVSKVKPITKGKWTIRPGVSEIKKLGLDLGVLRPDDLPDVKMPIVEPTP